MSANRIQHLDALRGIAIILVMLFHSYSRWPEFVPYSDEYSSFFIFKYGWLGVELFFLISGFVILMTLEKSSSFFDFIFKRWIRLFPAMLIATLIVYVTAGFFHERPAGVPLLQSIIPGLLFIEPTWISHLINRPIGGIEGAFWSLYVEFKFYVVAGFVFFLRKKSLDVIVSCIILYSLSSVIEYLHHHLIDNEVMKSLFRLSMTLSLNYFGWFASGALFYLYHKNKSKNVFYLGVLIGLFSSFGLKVINVEVIFSAFIVVIFFAYAIANIAIQKLLSNNFLVFVGFISYPLYLLHENILISSIIKIHHYNPSLPMVMLPIIPMLLLSMVSYFIVRIFEPKLRSVIYSIKIK